MTHEGLKEIFTRLDEHGSRGFTAKAEHRLEPGIRKRVYRDAPETGQINMLLAPVVQDGEDCRVALLVETPGGFMTRVPLGRQQILNLMTKFLEALQ